jgi:hypothetical protein
LKYIDILNCAACKEHNPLQLFVVEEVVEAPQAPGLAKRIRVQVGIVAVDVAIVQLYLVVDGRPQRILQAFVLLVCDRRQIRVDSVHYQLNRWLFAEFVTLK